MLNLNSVPPKRVDPEVATLTLLKRGAAHTPAEQEPRRGGLRRGAGEQATRASVIPTGRGAEPVRGCGSRGRQSSAAGPHTQRKGLAHRKLSYCIWILPKQAHTSPCSLHGASPHTRV